MKEVVWLEVILLVSGSVKEVYSCSSKGIGGKIKQRIEDFIVEEVGLNGERIRAGRFVERFSLDEKKEGWLEKVPGEGSGGEHLVLVMEKFNYDMNLAVRKIARFLQCSKERIGYAGMKDKRSVSAQRISLYKPDLERVRLFTNRSIELRNPFWSKDRIELGDLQGNYFTIVVRDIALDEVEARARLNELFKEIEEKGVANFFGVQRFQTTGLSYEIGKAVLKKDFEKAVKLFLCSPRDREHGESVSARARLAESWDYSRASREYPITLRFERAMIHYLCRNPEDYVGALRELPKRLRIMFTHALQSKLFNDFLEERIKVYGLGKAEGEQLLEGESALPLYGFQSVFDEGLLGEIERKVLEREGLDKRHFFVKEMKEMSSKGGLRRIVFYPRDLKLLRVFDDELNEGRKAAEIEFFLDKGCYATVLLKEITKSI